MIHVSKPLLAVIAATALAVAALTLIALGSKPPASGGRVTGGVDLSKVRIVIYYWNLHSEPEGLEGGLKVVKALDPDTIWYAHWVVGFPMPPNLRGGLRDS